MEAEIGIKNKEINQSEQIIRGLKEI